jgi:hypothetical protein
MVVLIKANGDIVNADACDDIRIEDVSCLMISGQRKLF